MRKVYLKPVSILGLVILCGAALGASLTIVIVVVFIVKRRTVIVHHACAGTHAFSVLSAILFCFAGSGLSVLKTTPLVCVLTSSLQMFPVTLLQGFLILTAYIICRKKPNVSMRKQILILSSVVILHAGVAASWYFISAPIVTHVVDKTAGLIYVDCGSETVFDTKTILLLLNIVLDCVGLATSYGIRTISENFHEGKYVFFTFVIHLMLWCATLATYLAITPGRHYQPVIASLAMQITGLSVLSSVYVPKLYLIRTKPEANEIVVQRSLSTSSMTTGGNQDGDDKLAAFKVIQSVSMNGV